LHIVGFLNELNIYTSIYIYYVCEYVRTHTHGTGHLFKTSYLQTLLKLYNVMECPYSQMDVKIGHFKYVEMIWEMEMRFLVSDM
jgi:hypothetical protein